MQKPLVDLGCGLGTNALHALAQGARVVAVDMTEEHLSEVRAKAGEAAVASGQLQTRFGKLPDDVPVADGEASGVLCAQVIYCLSVCLSGPAAPMPHSPSVVCTCLFFK